MKINVMGISEIDTKYEMQAPPTLNISVHLREYQVRELISNIIVDFGEEEVLRWIEEDR